MVASANGDAFLIDDGSDVVRMDAVENKGKHAGLLPSRADDSESGNLPQSFGRVREKLMFIGLDGFPVESAHIIDRGGQADSAGHVRGAGFELSGDGVVSGFLNWD